MSLKGPLFKGRRHSNLGQERAFQMSKRIQDRIRAEEGKIETRLERALEGSGAKPSFAASNIHYEISEKAGAIAHGGIGAIHLMAREVGLIERIDEKVHLLKKHRPYHESDHVLNIAYNALCGGETLDDIELRRNDRVFLDALGAESIPDPTTAGDFCRRFDETSNLLLQEAINETRLWVWGRQPAEFTQGTARIDADGSLVPTDGECKEGMDIAYNGVWGYHPLVVSLANTGEPLYLKNRSGNRPSFEGVEPLFDKAISLCRRAGFTDVLLRGDTDFAMTASFDRWTDDGVRFIFGYDARKNLIGRAEGMPEEMYRELAERAEREIRTKPRARPENIKEQIVREREYKNIRTESEEVVAFNYRPLKCSKDYRVVALRKNLSIEKGEQVLFDEIRYFFYIGNDWKLSSDEVINEARQRCNQENLIAQLKGGVRALHAPVNTLQANWAYMVMAALAWSLKAWTALVVPVSPRWKVRHTEEQRRLLRMEFRTFVAAFINLPCQIVKTGRKIVYRLLAWNPWQRVFFRLLNAV
jgi:hypothetical protein